MSADEEAVKSGTIAHTFVISTPGSHSKSWHYRAFINSFVERPHYTESEHVFSDSFLVWTPDGHEHECPRCHNKWKEFKHAECNMNDRAMRLCDRCVWGRL
jgi:hypothetical protein